MKLTRSKQMISQAIRGAIFLLFLLLAVFFDIEGAENFAVFFAWVFSISGLMTLSDEVLKEAKFEGHPYFPQVYVESFGFVCVSIMVWDGWFLTSIFFLISMILKSRIYGFDPEESKSEDVQDTSNVSQ